MTTAALPIADCTCMSKDNAAQPSIERPRTWGTVAEAVRGNVLARRMMPMGYMELILTSNCNLRCPYCFEKDKQPKDMSDETAVAAVDFLMDNPRSPKEVTFLLFGGEPMLRFDLIQKVHEYATRKANSLNKKVGWNMTTNGTLIDEEEAQWLARHKVKYLLSMDGGREDHNRNRKFPNGQGSYDLLVDRLPMMKRYQPWMGVKMSITPETAPRLRQNIDELHRHGVNQFIFGYAHGLPWTEADLLAYEEAVYDLCELYFEKRHHKEYFRITSFEEDALQKAEDPVPFGCGAGRGRICVDPWGDLYGCSKLATIMGPGKGVLPLGNVFQGYTKIENRKHCLNESIQFRKRCYNCELRKSCGGGCPATNFAETGDPYVPGEIACKLTFIWKRINAYACRRSKELFGENGKKRERHVKT